MSAAGNAEPVRVLFIGGVGRSGSTLLELILSQSADVCAVGEVLHMWDRAVANNLLCGCGEPFSSCPFWQKVGEHAFGGWSNVDAGEVLALKRAVDRTRFIPRLARRSLPEKRHEPLRRYVDYYLRVYRAATAVTGAQVVVDSSKLPSLAYALSWAPGLDLRVLHLVRDSRGVAYSWTKKVRRPEVVSGEAYMSTHSPAKMGVLWLAHNIALHWLSDRLPVRRLHYEDFTHDPVGTIQEVRRFAGLADTDEALRVLRDPAVTPARMHSISGNPMRFFTDPIRIRRDEAWRTRMPRLSRALVSAITWPLRLHYGYVLAGRAPREAERKEAR